MYETATFVKPRKQDYDSVRVDQLDPVAINHFRYERCQSEIGRELIAYFAARDNAQP